MMNFTEFDLPIYCNSFIEMLGQICYDEPHKV